MKNAEGTMPGGAQSGRELEEVLRRAREDDAEQSAGREHRYVFQGTRTSAFDTPLLRSNRKAIRRKYSTFNIILLLVAVAFGIVLYISNIISVNHLAAEVSYLQEKLNKITNAQAIVQAEIDRKSSWERIGNIATGELGLRFAHGQARWISPDEELIERAQPR